MGRIKTTQIKRVAIKLYKEHKDQFKKDFEKNKEFVSRFAKIPSKKLRNVVAGYVTRLMKKKHDFTLR